MKGVDLVIGSVKPQAEHQELFHYTSRVGFEAIVRTNTFWATHFKDLTDTEEITVLKAPLTRELAVVFQQVADRQNRHLRRMFNATSGGADKIAADFVNALYAATFESNASDIAVDAFTTSFSTHSADSDHVRANGLQSQWDGYAKDGFCIVLDTPEMCQILGREFDAHYWVHLNLDPIRYAVAQVPLTEHFPELMAAAEKSFSDIIRSGTHRAEMAVPEFLAGATLLKAARFKDEREVRIAAVPGTDVFRRAAKKEHAEFPDMPLPVIRPRPDKSGRRYIAIFDGVGVTLPIKRVIVGPSGHQAEHADLARSLVGADRVVLSALSIVPSAVPAG